MEILALLVISLIGISILVFNWDEQIPRSLKLQLLLFGIGLIIVWGFTVDDTLNLKGAYTEEFFLSLGCISILLARRLHKYTKLFFWVILIISCLPISLFLSFYLGFHTGFKLRPLKFEEVIYRTSEIRIERMASSPMLSVIDDFFIVKKGYILEERVNISPEMDVDSFAMNTQKTHLIFYGKDFSGALNLEKAVYIELPENTK